MRPLHRDNEFAVSPVIGIVLMLGITIILAAVVYVFSGGIAGDGVNEDGPKIGLTVDESKDRINVISADNGLTWDEFRLLPETTLRFGLNGAPSGLAGADVGQLFDPADGAVVAGNYIAVCADVAAAKDVTVRFIHIETNSQATKAVTFDQIRVCTPSITDTDGDGLTDQEEADLGTLPNNPDSDGDGLLDGAEVNTYGTDPLVVDTDGDNLGDGFEVNTHGTDPTMDDTDSDGKLDGDTNAAPDTPFDACPMARPAGIPAGTRNTTANNQADSDIDDDGCYNSEDPDIDGDGDLNVDEAGLFDDMDGDGIENGDDCGGPPLGLYDDDDDGDGIPDSSDTEPHGPGSVQADC